MEDVFLPLAICGMLFIGAPWIVLHYVTQWRKSSSLSLEDERLLDELHDTARRLDERMATIERILGSEDPSFRTSRSAPPSVRSDDTPLRRDH